MSVNLKIFIPLSLAVFVTTMGAGLVAPLLPVYAHELGAGAIQIGLIFAAFSLTRTFFVPYFGKLSDRRGKKPFLTTGLFLYFFLSLLYASSDSVWSLIFLRLGQGFASAMIFPVAQAYVGMITPSKKEGRIMGLFNASLYGGLSVGPLIGGVVKDAFNIKISFLSMGVLALSGFLLCLLLLPPEEKPDTNNPDPLRNTSSYMDLIRKPRILSLFAFRACFTTCLGIIWAFVPLLADTRLDLSSSAIGIVVMLNVFVAGLFQAPMGYLADRFSKKIMVTAGCILAIISILCLNSSDSFWGLAFGNGLFGFAGGVSFPAIMAFGVIEGRKTRAMGSVMGLLALGHSLGMLVGPLLAGVFIDLFSFKTIFFSGALIMAAGTMIFLRNQ